MSMPAFYLPGALWSPSPELDGDEARHAHVLRLKENENVILLDGMGRSAICRIANMQKKSVRLEILKEDFTPRPKSCASMALALSKATRRGFFLEKAAELGVSEIVLWRANRSQGHVSENLLQSCASQLVAGIKQCHNPWLPQISMADSVEGLENFAKKADWRILPWEETAGLPMLMPEDLGRTGITAFVIGPEGGFAESEIHWLKDREFHTVSLGNRVLRCETAAALCLGLHWWASQLPGHPDFRSRPDV